MSDELRSDLGGCLRNKIRSIVKFTLYIGSYMKSSPRKSLTDSFHSIT